MRYGLNPLDYTLWITSILSHWLLLFLLLRGKHSSRFPFFTTYIAFSVVEYPALFAINYYMTPADYFIAYYAGLALATLFNVLAAIELFREVLGPYNTIPVSTVSTMVKWLLTVILVGMAASLFINHPQRHDFYDHIRVMEKFVRFLIVGSLGVVLVVSWELNLPWSNRASGVCAGMLFCTAVQSVNTIFALHGPLAKFNRPIGMLAYVIAQTVWIYTFRKTSRPVTGVTDEFINALQQVTEQLRERKRVLTVS